MYRILIIFIVVIVVSGGRAKAQPVWFKTDSLTYRQYLDKDWENLLKEAKSSLRMGVDFYYLRVRAGIAAYELKNYRLAAKHLGKANEWNPADEFTKYWYYYALLMGNRKDEANLLVSGFNEDYLDRMQIGPVKTVNTVLVESQVTMNQRYNDLLSENITGDYSFMAYRNVLKQQFYKGLGIDHMVTGRLNLFHSFSHLGIKRMQMFGRALPPRLDHLQGSNTSQFQYYLQARYIPHKDWMVTVSGTLLWGESVSHYYTFSGAGVAKLNQYNYSIGDKYVGASVAKELVRIRPKLSVAYGLINGYRQVQGNAQMIFYPLGNNNLYFISDIALHSDESSEDINTVLNQKIGIKTGPLWLMAEGATGTMKNFSASDGYVVYNMPETINNLLGFSIFLPLLKYRFDITARYQRSDKQGTTFDYLNPSAFQQQSYNFSDNNFLISLRWHL